MKPAELALPWLLWLCSSPAGTLVLLPHGRSSSFPRGVSASGRCNEGQNSSPPGKDTGRMRRSCRNIAYAPWICTRVGGSSRATRRSSWKRDTVLNARAFTQGTPPSLGVPQQAGAPSEPSESSASEGDATADVPPMSGNSLPKGAQNGLAQPLESRHGVANDGDDNVSDPRAGGRGALLSDADPHPVGGDQRESAHLKLYAMQQTSAPATGQHLPATDSPESVDAVRDHSEDLNDEKPLPPGAVVLLEYCRAGSNATCLASIGGDVSKFATFLDDAVDRGLFDPPRDAPGTNANVDTHLEATRTWSRNSRDGRAWTRAAIGTQGQGTLVSTRTADANAGAEGDGPRQETKAIAASPSPEVGGRWAGMIRTTTVEVADEGVQERLRTLWKEEKLLSQERDAMDVLRGGEQSFSELLKSYTTRTKANHWEHTPPQRYLELLLQYDPEVRSDCGHDPDRPPAKTVSKLRKLLEWFRKEFPYYYDGCHTCENQANNTFVGYVYPTEDERAFRASRTEVYLCSACGAVSRFPRYAAASKVLETQRGRCGEYSVLMLRLLEALGYACRWVVDWSDHVWVEARIGERWVHVDPCEATIDEPLLYESWGKNQTYILAFTQQEVVDVTDKYTSDFEAAKARRDVDQETIAKLLNQARKALREP